MVRRKANSSSQRHECHLRPMNINALGAEDQCVFGCHSLNPLRWTSVVRVETMTRMFAISSRHAVQCRQESSLLLFQSALSPGSPVEFPFKIPLTSIIFSQPTPYLRAVFSSVIPLNFHHPSQLLISTSHLFQSHSSLSSNTSALSTLDSRTISAFDLSSHVSTPLSYLIVS